MNSLTDNHKILFFDNSQLVLQQGVDQKTHTAEKYRGNPVLKPEKPWEETVICGGTVRREAERYRMWYQSRGRPKFLNTYAESEDGIHWEKPILKLYRDNQGGYENNIFLNRAALRGGSSSPLSVNQDHNPNILFTPHLGKEKRYTLISYDYGRSGYSEYDGYFLAFSKDGIHWNDGPEEPVIPGHADVGFFTYDNRDRMFRGIVKTFLNIRGTKRRSVLSTASPDGYNWTLPKPAVIPDLKDDEWTAGDLDKNTQFYGMPIVRYESVLLGFLQVFRCTNVKETKHMGEIDLQLACSRDGTNWSRVGDRITIVPLGEKGEWDSGMIRSGNAFIIDDDEIRLYYTGDANLHGKFPKMSCIGFASWPRDRMVGLKADKKGVVITRPQNIAGDLHINANAENGKITAELLDGSGSTIEGFEKNRCNPLTSDHLNHVFKWKNQIPKDREKAVSVKLNLENAEIFSLWWN